MPLAAPALGAVIRAQLGAANVGFTQEPAATDFCNALASAIVTYLTANALVVVPSLGLVSAGPGSPVTGAAVGQIT